MLVPSSLNERWSMDFVSDQLISGQRFRVLNIIGEYSRESLGQLVDGKPPFLDVLALAA